MRRMKIDSFPRDTNLALIPPMGPTENLDQSALARAVLTEQSQNFALPQIQIDAPQGLDARKRLPHAAHFEE